MKHKENFRQNCNIFFCLFNGTHLVANIYTSKEVYMQKVNAKEHLEIL